MRAVEFYSGIGGWHYSLKRSWLGDFEVVAAYDINPAANSVYSHNLPIRPCPKSLEVVSARELDSHCAYLWMMSPPCQPHTRNNTTEKRDDADPRSASFHHITQQLGLMTQKPRYIILENVVGFETSNSCQKFLDQLRCSNYSFEQYIISPLQCGIPNSRPRYYCLAWLGLRGELAVQREDVISSMPDSAGEEEEIKTLEQYLESSDNDMSEFVISKDFISAHRQACWCWDIATRQSTSTACFTKGYTRYHKGTGSVLLVNGHDSFLPGIDGIERGEYREDWVESLLDWEGAYLRYFSPSELLKLFGFPESFTWPDDDKISKKKRYELIGNSINVTLASRLLTYLLSKPALPL